MAPDQPVLRDGDRLSLDGRAFTVRVSGRRKRLGLTVDRDGSLILHVPARCDSERAAEFVRQSHGWLEEKSDLQRRRAPRNAVRRMAEGETFRYLARDYRLRLAGGVDPEGATVRLVAGELLVDPEAAPTPLARKRAVADWYARVGLRWARTHMQPWAGRMDVPEPTLAVRDVGRHWGTYRRVDTGDAGRMALHWAVFQLPPPLIDYVIAHELAHARVAGHGPDYWRLLRRAIPECQERKAELDEMGRGLWLGELAE
ncbi:SprT family zinc-dependent metalloprotease [Streptomyces mayteni]